MPALILTQTQRIWHWAPDVTTSEALPDSNGIFDSFLLAAHRESKTSMYGYALHRHFDRFKRSLQSKPPGIFHLGEPLPTALTYELFLNGLKSICQLSRTEKIDIHVRIQATNNEIRLIYKNFTPRLPTDGHGASLITVKKNRKNFGIKYLPAIESTFSSNLAKEQQADDALLLTSSGEITETSWGNFFWINSDESVVTSTKALPGIIRALLLEKAYPHGEVSIGKLSWQSLKKSLRPCFMTSALHGITEIHSIDGIDLPRSSITTELQSWWKNRRFDFSQLTFLPSAHT